MHHHHHHASAAAAAAAAGYARPRAAVPHHEAPQSARAPRHQTYRHHPYMQYPQFSIAVPPQPHFAPPPLPGYNPFEYHPQYHHLHGPQPSWLSAPPGFHQHASPYIVHQHHQHHQAAAPAPFFNAKGPADYPAAGAASASSLKAPVFSTDKAAPRGPKIPPPPAPFYQPRQDCTKKLLILDVNKVLLHRIHSSYAEPPFSTVEGSIDVEGRFLVWPRPHVSAFLDFCCDKFTVMIWSSAGLRNIEPCLSVVFPDYKKRLFSLWDQSQCGRSGFHPDNKGRPVLTKQLQRVWARHPQFHADNTLIVDDDPLKLEGNPDHTSMTPPSWDCLRPHDTALALDSGDIAQYLARVAAAPSIRDFVRRVPFKADAAAPRDTDIGGAASPSSGAVGSPTYDDDDDNSS